MPEHLEAALSAHRSPTCVCKHRAAPRNALYGGSAVTEPLQVHHKHHSSPMPFTTPLPHLRTSVHLQTETSHKCTATVSTDHHLFRDQFERDGLFVITSFETGLPSRAAQSLIAMLDKSWLRTPQTCPFITFVQLQHAARNQP